MNKPPIWFYLVVIVALLWNTAGLFAVVADLRLSSSDIAALPTTQQAIYAARPGWSVAGSIIAVVGGTLGCLLLLLRRRLANLVFVLSLIGVATQDLGIFVFAGVGKSGNPLPIVLQGIVLLIAVGLLLLTRYAQSKSWLV